MRDAPNVTAILRPDLPGTYMVLVTVIDACNSTAQVTTNVTVLCQHAPRRRVQPNARRPVLESTRGDGPGEQETHAFGWWPAHALDSSPTRLRGRRTSSIITRTNRRTTRRSAAKPSSATSLPRPSPPRPSPSSTTARSPCSAAAEFTAVIRAGRMGDMELDAGLGRPASPRRRFAVRVDADVGAGRIQRVATPVPLGERDGERGDPRRRRVRVSARPGARGWSHAARFRPATFPREFDAGRGGHLRVQTRRQQRLPRGDDSFRDIVRVQRRTTAANLRADAGRRSVSGATGGDVRGDSSDGDEVHVLWRSAGASNDTRAPAFVDGVPSAPETRASVFYSRITPGRSRVSCLTFLVSTSFR